MYVRKLTRFTIPPAPKTDGYYVFSDDDVIITEAFSTEEEALDWISGQTSKFEPF